MVFPIAGGNESKGYEISNSLRFNDADSPHLTRTPSSSGNRRTWTMSCWFKKCEDGLNHTLFSTTGTQDIRFASNERFLVYGESKSIFNTNRLFRDPSAWYHIVVACDTTQSTASNRVKLYVNGTQETDFETNSQPSQNYDWNFNHTVEQGIGERTSTAGLNPHGYLADFHWIDGQQLDPTYFGETNDNGVWVPIKYTGTYGTNGFFMEFQQTGTSANSSGIGADTSGNDNHLTPANLAATDITEDTPTNNFATMLPILYTSDVVTFSEGNVKLVGSSSADGGGSWASIVPTSGKWYAEVKNNVAVTSQLGLATVDTWSDARNMLGNGTFLYAQDNNTAVKLRQGGSTANASVSGGSNSYSTWSNNTIINIALDMDNGKAYFGINGTYMNSSNPADGTNSFSLHTDYTSGVTFACGLDAATVEWNFGNPSFAISSGNTDGKYGNFEYAPPSGYYALCTKRLAEFG